MPEKVGTIGIPSDDDILKSASRRNFIKGVIAGGVAGVLIGANLSAILPARPLRVGLALWLSFIGAQLAWKGLF